jgi:uncharacterized protein (DUF302 family)
MSYYFSKSIEGSIAEVREKVIENLKDVGFGVITEINMKDKFREKLGVDFNDYIILGACNPGFAYEAVQLEEELGVLLPCNVVLIGKDDGRVQVAAIDAAKMMSVVGNPKLDEVAATVNERLKQALGAL